MTKRKTNRRDATGEKEERGPHKVRLVLDIMDRISALTPREIIEMPYETLREVMYFLGLDPDKPLSDDILCLIDKLQSEKARRPGLRLMVKEDEAEQMRLSADENRDRPPFFHQPGVEVGG